MLLKNFEVDPFLRRGDTNTTLLENFYIAKPNSEMVLSNSFTTFRNRSASAHDRAVSLCWALHLTGDLHQPLHAANLVSKATPHGNDLGGAFVALDPRGEVITLHAFWDRVCGVNVSYRTLADLADELAASPELQRAALPEYQTHKTIAPWVQESFRIAVDFAYSEDHVQYVRGDAVASGKVARSAIPALSADYVREAQKLARRRLALAAWRLSDELQGAW